MSVTNFITSYHRLLYILNIQIGESAAFVRSTDKKLFPAADFPGKIEPAGTRPHLELFAMPIAFTEHGHGPIASGDSVCILATLTRCVSLRREVEVTALTMCQVRLVLEPSNSSQWTHSRNRSSIRSEYTVT